MHGARGGVGAGCQCGGADQGAGGEVAGGVGRLVGEYAGGVGGKRDIGGGGGGGGGGFSLDDLKYEYPEEICPAGVGLMDYLRQRTWEGARERYPCDDVKHEDTKGQ